MKRIKTRLAAIMLAVVMTILPSTAYASITVRSNENQIHRYVYEALLLDSTHPDSPFYRIDLSEISLGAPLTAYKYNGFEILTSDVLYVPVFIMTH